MLKEQFGIKTENLDKTIKKKPKEDPVGLFLDRFGTSLDIEHLALDKIDFSHLNTAQQAESLWSVFKNIVEKSIFKLREKSVKKLGTKEKERLRLSLGIVKKLYQSEEVKEKYLEAYQRHIQEAESINGNFERYKSLKREIKDVRSVSDEQAKQVFSQRGGSINEVDLLMAETGRMQLKGKQQELKELVDTDPELGALVQYENLKSYAEQLRNEKFIWTPSRMELLEETEEASLSGHPVLLSGESGTGKTRLVEQVALKLTGQINNETPGKDVRFQDLIAKPKISPDGGTYYEYKEIGEAATGRSSTLDKVSQHAGRIVADDEFNLLPEAEQTERLARIATWTPGKKVRMPVTNQEVNIADNFLYCAMVNLASERYTRKKIPPEVLRKFAKVDVDYPIQTEDDPEIYEMMLAAIMDENGRIRVPKGDIDPKYTYDQKPNIIERDGQSIKQTIGTRELIMQEEDENGQKIMAGGFLWRLSNALNEINKSFSRKETVLKSKGEAQYLKDMIIDIGTILGWMKEYSTVGRNKNLEVFFCEKIQKQFLAREAYTADDRKLVKEFLKYYDIDVDKKPEERKTKEFEIMTVLEIGLLSPRVRYEKVIAEEPIVTESYYMTPEGKRIEYRIEKYQEGDREFSPGQVFVRTDPAGKRYAEQFMGVRKDTGDPVIKPYKQEIKPPKEETKAVAPVAKASWKNPETQIEQELEIDFEKNLAEQKTFYKNRLNLEINESEARAVWKKNFAEIRAEISKLGYDSILIVPDNLPDEEVLNQKIIETMEENVGGTRKKVAATWQGSNFQNGGSFAGVRSSYSPEYKIVLTHSVNDPEDHPVLKCTRNKNIMDVTSMTEQEVGRRITNGEKLPVDCEIEIDGKKVRIQAEGQSLKEYMIQQAMHFEKTGQHLDSKSSSYAWLLKSFSGSRVVGSRWLPGGRRLAVNANDASYRHGYLGLRLSRSFSK